MKKNRPYVKPQCNAIVQPGEYDIDRWDNKRCLMVNGLGRCPNCREFFCYLFHLHNHTDQCTGGSNNGEGS